MPEDPAPAAPRDLTIDEKATHDAIDAKAAALASAMAEAGLTEMVGWVESLRGLLHAAIVAR